MSCHVMSCHVMSCYVMLYYIILYTHVSIQVASCLLPICSEIYNCIDEQIKFHYYC